MENAYAETGTTAFAVSAQKGAGNFGPSQATDKPELMAPGHLYNPRTGTGIEWLPTNLEAEEPGRVRLWSRQWGGEPIVVAEAVHRTGSPWEYWYNLEFANSFPQVTHWWFGDAWTGIVRVWQPEGVGRDPESGAPMLTGWMRFGPTETSDADGDGTPALPWTVLLSKPLRVSTPLPPMTTNQANLPLQLLVAGTVMEMLGMLADRGSYSVGTVGITGVTGVTGGASLDVEVALTSLVRREDLYRAFPAEFGLWRLDRLSDLTPREALCQVQGLEPALAGTIEL